MTFIGGQPSFNCFIRQIFSYQFFFWSESIKALSVTNLEINKGQNVMMLWAMFVYHQNPYVEAMPLNAVVFGDGNFGVIRFR